MLACASKHTHSTHMHVPVCLFSPPVLPPSALKHAPRPRLPGQSEPKVPDGGWGGSAKGDPVLPAYADWGPHAPTGTLMGEAAPVSPVSSSSLHRPPPNPPNPWFFWASCGHPPAERILWQKGEGWGRPQGTCFQTTLAKLPGEED